MRGGKFSLAVIALCALAVVLIPPLRRAGRGAAKTGSGHILPTTEQLARAAAGHPGDVYIALAASEGVLSPSELPEDAKPLADKAARLRSIASLYPTSPAAHLYLGRVLLAISGPLEREESLDSAAAQHAPLPSSKRTEQEEKNLAEAIAQLRLAATLAPTNAAPDYLLAYALFAQHADKQADEAFRATLSMPAWTLYEREIRQALLTLYEDSGMPTMNVPITVLASSYAMFPYSGWRSLARLLAGLSDQERKAGDNTKAVFHLASAAHLGQVMLVGADSILNLLNAESILAVTAGRFISKQERQQVESLQLPRDKTTERISEIRRRNFEAYLISQGKGDIAKTYAQDYRQAQAAEKKLKAASEKMLPEMMAAFNSRSMKFAVLSWFNVSLIFWLLSLAAILSLAAGSWRAKGAAPVWRWREWGALVLIAFLPSYLAFEWSQPFFQQAPVSKETDLLYEIGICFAIACLSLLVFVPLIGGLLKHRRLPAENRLGRFHACLASYRTLLPSTLAVMLVVALVFTAFAQLRIERWAAGEKQMIQQGEVHYWQIGVPEK